MTLGETSLPRVMTTTALVMTVQDDLPGSPALYLLDMRRVLGAQFAALDRLYGRPAVVELVRWLSDKYMLDIPD